MSDKNKKKETEEKDGDPVLSGIVAAATDSTILGALVGGSLTGALIGDLLDGDLTD